MSNAWHGNEAVYFKILVNMAQMFAYYQDVLNIKYLLTKKAITKGYKVQATLRSKVKMLLIQCRVCFVLRNFHVIDG